MKTQAKTKTYQITQPVQTAFIGLSFAAYALQLTSILYWAIRQYPNNHNLSGYLLISVDGLLFPAIMFVAAYFSNKKADVRGRMFEALLFTSMGTLVLSILNLIGLLTYNRYIVLHTYWQSVAYDLITTATVLLIYLAVLARYRRRNR